MAQETSKGAGIVTDSPTQIRAEMAKTRATLERELGALKSRVFGTPAKKGIKAMTQTKAKSAGSSKKTPKAKKAGSGRAATATKTKEVLKKVLTGAAVGAVKGAAEALLPAKKNTAK